MRNEKLAKEVEKGEDMLVVDIERIPSYNLGLKRGLVMLLWDNYQ